MTAQQALLLAECIGNEARSLMEKDCTPGDSDLRFQTHMAASKVLVHLGAALIQYGLREQEKK